MECLNPTGSIIRKWLLTLNWQFQPRIDMENFARIFSQIQKDLDLNADQEYREKIRDHFKMDVSNFLGVKIPVVRQIGNKYS